MREYIWLTNASVWTNTDAIGKSSTIPHNWLETVVNKCLFTRGTLQPTKRPPCTHNGIICHYHISTRQEYFWGISFNWWGECKCNKQCLGQRWIKVNANGIVLLPFLGLWYTRLWHSTKYLSQLLQSSIEPWTFTQWIGKSNWCHLLHAKTSIHKQ